MSPGPSVKYWIGLAIVLVLMVGGFVVLVRSATGGPGGYHWVCARDGSSCVDGPNQ
jgi:hypothetical protein